MPDPEPVASWLFAYGTLSPDGPEAAARGGWSADAIRGRLHDLGPYPTVDGPGDPAAGWVEGFVRAVDEAELSGRLDLYEGVAEGLYRRQVVITRSGRAAWVYSSARPLPAEARRPLDRWAGLRGVEPGPGLFSALRTFDDAPINRPGPDG